MNYIDRSYLDATGKTSSFYTEDNQSPSKSLSYLATLGAEYKMNDGNSLGLSGNFSSRKMVKNEVETNGTAFWQHNFKKEDHELRVEFNASKQDEKEGNHYPNVYFLPKTPTSLDNTVIKQGEKQQQLTIDYSNPLSEDAKLEAGYSGSFAQINMNFYGESFNTAEDRFVKDLVKSNQFLYNESIHALYATYQRSYEKFGYSLGLRAEQAFIHGNLVTKDSLVNNAYFKVYPTLHLSYKLKTGELQLNYSKRVHRPEGDDLNPFPEYRDPQNLRAGNPKLLPEVIHSFETGYKWQNKTFTFVPSLYYRYKENGFTTVTIPLNDSTLLTTQQNLSNDQSAGLELILSAKAGDFFSTNMSSNIFYNQIDATYRSARLTPQGKAFPTFVVNAGIRQDLMKTKMSIILTVSDVFRTLKQQYDLSSPYLKQVGIGKRDAQIVYLSISYKFGKSLKKTNEDKMQFDNSL